MLDVQLREEDVVTAARTHFGLQLARPATLAFFGILLLLLIVAVAIDVAAGRFDPVFPIGAAFILTMIALLWFWTVPRAARRAFRQQAGFAYPISYAWEDSQFRLTSRTGESRLAWDEIFAWHGTPDLVLIYLSANLYHLVPARAFASADERMAFEARLAGNGVPARRSGGRRR